MAGPPSLNPSRIPVLISLYLYTSIFFYNTICFLLLRVLNLLSFVPRNLAFAANHPWAVPFYSVAAGSRGQLLSSNEVIRGFLFQLNIYTSFKLPVLATEPSDVPSVVGDLPNVPLDTA